MANYERILNQYNIKKLHYENEIEICIQNFKNFSGTKEDYTFLSDGLEVDNNILEDRLEKLKFKNRELTIKIQEIKSAPISTEPPSQNEIDISDYLQRNHALNVEKKKLKKGIDIKNYENEQILAELDEYQTKRSEYIQSNLTLHEDYKKLDREYRKLNICLGLKDDQIKKELEKSENHKAEIDLNSIENSSAPNEILHQYNKISNEIYSLTQQIATKTNKNKVNQKKKKPTNNSSEVESEGNS